MYHENVKRTDGYCRHIYTTKAGTYTLSKYRTTKNVPFDYNIFDNMPNPHPWCVLRANTPAELLAKFKIEFAGSWYYKELLSIVEALV